MSIRKEHRINILKELKEVKKTAKRIEKIINANPEFFVMKYDIRIIANIKEQLAEYCMDIHTDCKNGMPCSIGKNTFK